MESLSSMTKRAFSFPVFYELKSISHHLIVEKLEELEYYVVYHGKFMKAPALMDGSKFHGSSHTDALTDISYRRMLQSRSYHSDFVASKSKVSPVDFLYFD